VRGAQTRDEASAKGATMRLGAQEVLLGAGTRARDIFGRDLIMERHRHRYEFNNNYLDRYRQSGMRFAGFSRDDLVEVIELPNHPWFLATQFHPEFTSKASFDKANRSSGASFRGPGIEAGLKVLDDVRRAVGVPVLTDVHEDTPLSEVAAVVDVLQTPAFLCRQTNFIVNTASQGKPVNIKKGQFLSPWEMRNVVDKARSTGNQAILVCERGFSFGYNNLVSDMRSLSILRATG